MSSGKWLILGILGLGLALSSFAVFFHMSQEAELRERWGSDALNTIRHAQRVEFLKLGEASTTAADSSVEGTDGKLPILETHDISAARGLVHVKFLLVKDQSYVWERELPAGSPRWAFALRFVSEKETPPITLLFDPKLRFVFNNRTKSPVEMKVIIERVDEYCREALAETSE